MLSGSAPSLYPADTHYGLLWYGKDEALEIPKRYPYKGDWGKSLSSCILLRENYPMPYKLNLLWLSIVEEKFYVIEEFLPQRALEDIWKEKIIEGRPFSHIIIGMAPYGNVALWFYSEQKSKFLAWMYANSVDIPIEEFIPQSSMSLHDYCLRYINSDSKVKGNFIKNGLPPRNLFDKYMQQFTYRYLPIYEKWCKDACQWIKYEEGEETIPEFEYIEESLYDGTHDKLHDDGLLKYHAAGKPKKIAVKWHIKKSEYTAYFWFDETIICEIFEKFYGAHRDTKVDFIIRIDAEQKKYELSLYRYGLKEPLVIPEDAYQLLVFKSKFEHYRSENYNQERGAWIW